MSKPEMVKDKIEKAIEGAKVEITSFPGRGNGDHIGLRIIGNCFEGDSRIERHQKVMNVLNEDLVSGYVHAVQLKIYTENEYQEKLNKE